MAKTNSKKTRRALLGSLLSLVICVTMLVGSTYAWFTDTATTGVNTIQSGTLDVALVNEAGESLEGQTLGFVTADNRAQDLILWEPGCTYALEPVFVKNEGNLALKYKIVVNGIDGDATLLEAIDWTIEIDGVETDLATFEGHLDAQNDLSGEIVITGHMKEEAGNEYQNLTVNGISITVYATQYTYESDSIDNQYDADAAYPVVVGDFDSMSTALSSIAANEPLTLNLTDDIVVPDDAAKSAISIPANANVTIDLNGHTISGGRSDVRPNYGMINVGMNSTLTIENGTVTYGDDGDSTFSAYRNTISVQRGTLVIKNATIQNTCQSGISSAIDIMSNTGAEDAKLIIEDSTIESTRYGVRLFGNSVTGSAILEMKNTTVNATSSAIFLHQPSSNKKGLIEATITDSAITGRSGVYLWDCGNTASVDGDNIKLVLNGTTTLTSTGTYSDKATAISAHDDGAYPGFANGIVVDYSTAAADTNFKVTDNR